jgi:hypothetical protein
MPGGIFDSSKTRVAPVFDALSVLKSDWVSQLLALTQAGQSSFSGTGLDLAFQKGAWGETETPIPPPVSLLSWLIRNPTKLREADSSNADRYLLLRGSPAATAKALDLLRTEGSDRAWYVFEGPTVPDAYIETPDAIVVVEGKRTEAGPTTDTTWMQGRHQIWRHIDAAWERKGRRRVFGLFIVEGEPSTGAVPELWMRAAQEAVSSTALSSSFPHRSAEERAEIVSCFLGVTTWQRVVQAFQLPQSTLIERLSAA